MVFFKKFLNDKQRAAFDNFMQKFTSGRQRNNKSDRKRG